MADLATARLRLEVLTPQHAEALFQGLQAPAIYAHIAEDPPVSVEALRGRYERMTVGHSPDGTEHWLNWALWSHQESRYVGYVQATVTVGADISIAYVLFPDAWGRGYAREAVAAMVTELVRVYAPPAVRATVDTRNLRSARLLVALGFKHVALRPGAEWIHGVLTDEAEYAQTYPRVPE